MLILMMMEIILTFWYKIFDYKCQYKYIMVYWSMIVAITIYIDSKILFFRLFFHWILEFFFLKWFNSKNIIYRSILFHISTNSIYTHVLYMLILINCKRFFFISRQFIDILTTFFLMIIFTFSFYYYTWIIIIKIDRLN